MKILPNQVVLQTEEIENGHAVEKILPNQVVFRTTEIENGFGNHLSERDRYKETIDEDATNDTDLVTRILGDERRVYLDHYFPGWRLLVRVQEGRRHPRATPWKKIYFVIDLFTDADADTVRSRWQKEIFSP